MREEGRRRWGRDRPPTLEEARRSARADDAAWSEVQAAVQPRSAGRSRAEVRQLIIEELRSRNRPVPDDMILDPHVDQIMLASPLPPLMDPDTSALTALKTLLRTARQARTQHKRFAAAMSSAARPLLGPHGQPPYLVEPDYSLPMADVVLDPGATAMPERSGGGIVSLERDPGAGDAARVVVYSGQQRVGTQAARHPDIVLHVVDGHAGKRVHHVLVGVVAQADVEDDVAGGNGMSRVPHPLHPGRIAGADVVESGGKLMTDEIVLRCKHILLPALAALSPYAFAPREISAKSGFAVNASSRLTASRI